MSPALTVSFKTVAAFLEATEGNYRNAAYVSCPDSCSHAEGCRDFLFIPDGDGTPIILPVSDAQAFLSKPIAADECAFSMKAANFIRIFRRYLDLAIDHDGDCPIRTLLHLPECAGN